MPVDIFIRNMVIRKDSEYPIMRDKYLYSKIVTKAVSVCTKRTYGKRLQQKLLILHPGKDSQHLLYMYFSKKIYQELLCCIVSVIFLVMLFVSGKVNSVVDKEGRINRPANSKQKMVLVADTEDMSIPINVEILKKGYAQEEIDYLVETLNSELMVSILNGNQSLEYIVDDLYLPNQVEGYPFYIQWSSNKRDILNDNGEICFEELPGDGEDICLKYNLSYKDYEYEGLYAIKVYPPNITEEEQLKKEIIASIQTKQEESKNKKYLQLPLSIGGKEISWKQSSGNKVLIVAIFCIISSLGIWWGVDNDLTKQCEKRDQLLRLDYSELVSKLQFLISSGMTIRGALERMEADYKLAKKDMKREKYVYEELAICLKRLRDGASESSCYLLFGNRCGLLSYKKLTLLLVQNLNKGNKGLTQALAYEAKAAFEERKHIARRLGDEAQVKLLIPMTLMLCVVMVIIIVPAYFSFGI